MSNQENQNDPLERLFRKKAEEYNFSYREEDWLKLEKQLDARDMKLYYRRRFRWLAAASVLILSLIGYYTFQNHNKINQLTEQLNQQEVIQQNEEPSIPADRTETDEIPDSGPENMDQAEPNRLNLAENTRSEQISESDNTVNRSVNSTENRTTIRNGEGENASSNFNTLAANQELDRRSIRPDETLYDDLSDRVYNAQTFEPVQIVNTRKLNRSQYSGLIAANRRDNFQTEKRGAENASMTLSDHDKQSNKRPAKDMSRLSIGFVLSPDMSTAGAVSNFYDPGIKGGVLAEYSFTKNISLISGITISNVRYKADGDSYNLPEYWNSGLTPDEATAVCAILDIPLNVKSNIFHFENSRIFATAGISSYIMLNEDYQFNYNDENITGVETSHNESSASQYWFSNAGLSVGIDYDIHPNWTLRAEPHIKVPLKGVGWADVDLYSMGSFISLNYQFSK